MVTLCLVAVQAAEADNAVQPGELIVDPPTLICLGFYWPMEGDANHNAAATIEFRKKGDVSWRRGLDLFRTHGETAGDGGMVAIRRIPNAFAGSIFDLNPGTEYECRLTLSDPDGVKGEAVRTIPPSHRRPHNTIFARLAKPDGRVRPDSAVAETQLADGFPAF